MGKGRETDGEVLVAIARLEERVIAIQAGVDELKEGGTRVSRENEIEIERLKGQLNIRSGIGGVLIGIVALFEEAAKFFGGSS